MSIHALTSKALKHWKEYLPAKTKELKQQGPGVLEASARAAAIMAQQEIINLMQQGWQEHEAEEVVLPQFILLKPEPGADLEDWEAVELAEREAQYQDMMKEPPQRED